MEQTASKNPSRREFRIVFVLFFILLGFSVYWFFPSRPSMSQDNIPHALLPIVLLRNHTFTFDSLPHVVEAAKKGGISPTTYLMDMYYFSLTPSQHIVSSYPIFTGIMITPVYWIYSLFRPSLLQIDDFSNYILWNANYLAAILFTIASAFFMYFVFRNAKIPRPLSYLGVLLYVFATAVISTSSRFVSQHTIALFFIPLMLWGYQRKKPFWFMLGTIGACLSRPSVAVLALPFWIDFLLWVRSIGFKKYITSTSHIYAVILTMVLVIAGLAFTLWYSIMILGGSTLFGSQYQLNRLSAPLFIDGMSLLFSPGRGLFIFTPLFVFAIIEMIRRNKTILPYITSVILYISLMAIWDMWWGGWTFGYRMIIETVPILMIFVIMHLERFRQFRPIHQYLIVGAVFLSVVFQSGIGGYYYDCGFNGRSDPLEKLNADQTTWKMWHGSELITCIQQIQRR